MKNKIIKYSAWFIIAAFFTFGAIKIISLKNELDEIRAEIKKMPIRSIQSDIDMIKSEVDNAIGRIGDLEDRQITIKTETYSY